MRIPVRATILFSSGCRAGDDSGGDTGVDTAHLEQHIMREDLSPLPAVRLPKLTKCEKSDGGRQGDPVRMRRLR
jgi:hypothetical protein